MKRIAFLILILCGYVTVCAQDVITLKDGRNVNCKITKIDSLNIHFDFKRNGKTISTYASTNEIRSYKVSGLQSNNYSQHMANNQQSNEVIVDTSTNKSTSPIWNNMITIGVRVAIYSAGWSLQYYGFSASNKSRWTIPCKFGIEGGKIFIKESAIDEVQGYEEFGTNYFMAGVTPFYKLNNYFYLNLGAQLVFGSDYYKKSNGDIDDRFIIGIATNQGIYFIPKSKFGITIGIGIFEKLLTSKIYSNDLGFSVEIGFKF